MKAGGEEIMSLHSFRKLKIPMFYMRCMHVGEFLHTILYGFNILAYIPLFLW